MERVRKHFRYKFLFICSQLACQGPKYACGRAPHSNCLEFVVMNAFKTLKFSQTNWLYCIMKNKSSLKIYTALK